MKKRVHNINIQVYVTDTSALKDPILYNKLLEKMPNYRKEKINNFNFPKDRNLSLAAGVLLSYSLKKNGYAEEELEIAYGEFEKPYFKNHPELNFNLAHSGERAICAIAISKQPLGNEIGCDVEENTPEQIEYLKEYNMSVEQWTRLESYAKATQTDLEKLFYGEASIMPGFMFTHPEIEPNYEYNICCRSKIPSENIQYVDLKEIEL